MSPSRARTPAKGTVALALGGGGARGLAHIVALEVLDDLGVRPAAIVGTSMGAIVGAAYAAGVSGQDLRKHALDRLKDRAKAMALLLQARVGRITDIFSRGLGANPVLLDGEKVLDLFWPEAVPDLFSDLAIPFSAVATDYTARVQTVFDTGPLVTGVGASMAIPGLIRPVLAGGHVYVDGGVVNPLPFDLLAGQADIVVAVDVAGGAHAAETSQAPGAFEAMLGSAQIMQGAIVAEKLKATQPDILVRPAVGGFRALDFFRARQILQAAEASREGLKRDIAAAFEAVSAGRRKTT
ncbi:patatin-like phospholipase family protein [uncultured Alsobacter sp.]|uniref:patatin-like phospholipase family protein n=1 Tax=uncultured Alsobacter sp. TaxID=1748258 RepID=UPI0025FADA48|nr:patatin-like phospholipase family protein [uncultured Alsobacter sp.]